MKISLEEARKRATQEAVRIDGVYGRNGIIVRGLDEGPIVMDPATAALLVHKWNRFDEVVAALEAVVVDLDLLSNCPGGSSELQHMVETALIKAKTVEMP